MSKPLAVFSLILAFSLSVAAQRNEIGFLAGGKTTPDGTSPSGTTKVNTAFAFEVNYAGTLIPAKVAAIEINIPLIAAPTSDINSSSLFTAKSYSSIYFTPGLRLRVGTSVSPWIEAGVGFAHFNPSSTNLAGAPSGASASTKAAFDVAGGLDIRPSKSPIGFRFEARELYTGVPDLAVPKLNLNNNVLLGGGIVLRF